MNTTQLTPLPEITEDRLVALFNELGLGKVHMAARQPGDWLGLAQTYPERVASLSIVCPSALMVEAGAHLTDRLQVIVGDQSLNVAVIQQSLANLPEARQAWISNYASLLWSDVITEQEATIGNALKDLITDQEAKEPLEIVDLPEGEGEIAGIRYDVRGSGLPLVLFPLGLAPNQWDALIPTLSEQYCTITLSGAYLGMVPMLEARGKTTGYQQMLATMLAEVNLQAGETVLEVGCGTGVIDRWLAHRTQGANPIIGVDFNPYLLREATVLARQDGCQDIIDFQEGNAENLPLPDNHVDVAISSTVMEEVDADKMLAEMIRVTKPGGRVGVIVRAMDMPRLFNIPVDPALKARVEVAAEAQAEGAGCSSVSLYRRFQQSELIDVTGQPLLAVFGDAYSTVGQFILGSTATMFTA
ncbi:MAG: methyltransferase domain-containing protein, partial [Chloroflexota bacterium]